MQNDKAKKYRSYSIRPFENNTSNVRRESIHLALDWIYSGVQKSLPSVFHLFVIQWMIN